MAARTLLSPDRLPDKGITLGNDQRKALEDKGRFPKRVPITDRTHAYVESEIDDWIAQRPSGASLPIRFRHRNVRARSLSNAAHHPPFLTTRWLRGGGPTPPWLKGPARERQSISLVDLPRPWARTLVARR